MKIVITGRAIINEKIDVEEKEELDDTAFTNQLNDNIPEKYQEFFFEEIFPGQESNQHKVGFSEF